MNRTSWMLCACLPAFLAYAATMDGASTSGPSDPGSPLASPVPQPSAVVRLDSGEIVGTSLGDVEVYRGVPYAAPPVGDLRWRPPQPVSPWSGVRPSVAFGPSCPQPDPTPGRISEDCLYLNVWTPARRSPALPVLFWIHGGGFIRGSASLPEFDGTKLARQGVVVVTINYRLGPLGFLAHPLLSRESPRGVSGNYGLLDQMAALDWVRRNIAPFGGDPNLVTVVGQSAGAISIGRLLVSPLAEGLFHRAIAMSGTFTNRAPFLKDAEKGGLFVQARVGCLLSWDPLACMRSKIPEELLQASDIALDYLGVSPFLLPNVDGWVLPDQPWIVFQNQGQHRVPLVAGATSDEMKPMIQLVPGPFKSVVLYRVFLKAVFGDFSEEVFRLFPAHADQEVPGAANRLITAWLFVSQARSLVRSMDQVVTDVYLYHFTRVAPGAESRDWGAHHSADIPYVFGNFAGPDGYYDERDSGLSNTMMRYWVQFATTGNPNGGVLPFWPRHSALREPDLELGDELWIVEERYREACDLFDQWERERLWRFTSESVH